MKIKYPQIDVDAELDDFRDYCLAHGRMTGKEAYRDFDAAFRQRLKNDFPKKMKAGFKTPPGQCGPGRNPATRGYAVAGGNGRRSVKPEPAVRDVKPGAYEL